MRAELEAALFDKPPESRVVVVGPLYLDFYRLREKPFNTTPDPRFLHLTSAHREALAQLVYGVREGKGFMLLTGDVGTGKTTLLRALLERLNGTTAVAFVFNSTLPFDEMLEYVLEDLGVSSPGASRAQRLFALNRFLIERQRAVLIVDEAQNLDAPTLEQIRLLSNFETAREKLLQIVLVGQPELRKKLQRRELRQLHQRIGLRAHIRPLADNEVGKYIQTRLRVAGGVPRLFDRQAVKRIAAYSKGVPRVVNILCEHCLVIGYADDAGTITRDIVEQGIDSLEAGEGRTWQRRLAGAMKWLVGGAVTAAIAGLVAPHVGPGDLGNLPHRIVEYLNGIVGAARDLLLQ
jgi:general secretion pathway protein A